MEQLDYLNFKRFIGAVREKFLIYAKLSVFRIQKPSRQIDSDQLTATK